MRPHDSDFWFEAEELEKAGLLAAARKGTQRGSLLWQMAHLDAGCTGKSRTAYYRYGAMMPKHQATLRAVLLNGLEPADWLRHHTSQNPPAATAIEGLDFDQIANEEHRDFLLYYRGQQLDRLAWVAERKQTTLARACALVRALLPYAAQRDSAPFRLASAWLEQHTTAHDATPLRHHLLFYQYLPQNPVALKRKVQAVADEVGALTGAEFDRALAGLIQPPRSGEKATYKGAIQQDLEIRGHFFRLLTSGRGLPQAFCIRAVRQWCQLTGRPVPSESWFRSQQSDHHKEFLTARHRYSRGNPYRQGYEYRVLQSRPVLAGEVWSIDGTRLNLEAFLKNKDKVSDGRQHLYLVAVHDAASGAFVGYHFDTTEDHFGVYAAFKMAVELNGYLPHELRMDQSSAYSHPLVENLLDHFRACGVTVTISSAPQAKAIERAFDTLQTVMLAGSRLYYGQGIRSTRPFAHATDAYLTKVRKWIARERLGFEELWLEAVTLLERYNHTPLCEWSKAHAGVALSPADLHAQSRDEAANPCVRRLDPTQVVEVLWLGRTYDVRQGDLLTIQVHKREYHYELPYEVASQYAQVHVRLDLFEPDAKSVLLFDPRNPEVLLGEATRTERIRLTGPNPEWSKLHRRQAKIEADRQRADEALAQILAPVDDAPESDLLVRALIPKTQGEASETAWLVRNQREVTAPVVAKVAAKTARPVPVKVMPTPAPEYNFREFL